MAQQNLIEVLSDNFTVNSVSAFGGNTRNFAEVVLPDNAIGYVYRLTVVRKGAGSLSNSLFTLLKQQGTNVTLGVSLAQFAIQNADGNAVDAYIFSSPYDKDNFYAKRDGSWNACKQMPNRSNCCFSTRDCLGKRVYFGFRNNNTMQGLDVKLEVVAVVDTTHQQQVSNTFSITNGSTREIEYQISSDGIRWEKVNVRPNYSNNHSSILPELMVRIYTTPTQFVSYKIQPM